MSLEEYIAEYRKRQRWLGLWGGIALVVLIVVLALAYAWLGH
jgi:hypothetical protein